MKKLLESRWLRFGLSFILIFLAFRKIDIPVLAGELAKLPTWFVVAMIVWYGSVTLLGGWRWSLLLIKKTTFKDVWNFTKANFIGGFYNLVFPTGVAGDLLKWMPLQKKYPELNKTKLLGSSLLDRVVGFTAFIIVAFVAALLGLLMNFDFPLYLFLLFSGLFVGVVVFYLVVFNYNAEKWLDKYPKLKKIDEIIELLKAEDKKRLLRVLGVAFLTEFAWITPIWFTSMVVGAGMSMLSVFIFMPVIALILVLPISMAGFGAREQLFLYFFSQVGATDVKILAVSTFIGIVGVFNYLIGGVFLFFK